MLFIQDTKLGSKINYFQRYHMELAWNYNHIPRW